MKELILKSAIGLLKPCRNVVLAGEQIVTVADGWNITEATIGVDENDVKHRLILTIDRDDGERKENNDE